MTHGTPSPWQRASKERLEEALDALLEAVEARSGTAPIAAGESEPANALDALVLKFGLGAFERDLLLLSAGWELDGRFAKLLGGPPTFGRALELLGGGHWSALAPDGALRRGRLVALEPGAGLVGRNLRIEETVLQELLGLPQLDERLRPFVEPLAAPAEGALYPSHARAAARLAAFWIGSSETVSEGERPAVLIDGGERGERRAIVAAAASSVGCGAFALDASLLPEEPAAGEELLELWQRDSVLQNFALVIELGAEPTSGRSNRLAGRWLERLPGLVAAAGHGEMELERPRVRLSVEPVPRDEQHALWRAALGPLAESLDGRLEALVQQFSLPLRSLREVAAELPVALAEEGTSPADGEAVAGTLWRLVRHRARGATDLGSLAQRLEPVAEWPDLVLPEEQLETLRTLAMHVRQRNRVYDDWGFAAKSRRGLGIGALFHGPSGTGKTMAAEVLARDLGLDLYRIDLSAIISKYIGETEKNLSRLFDAAEKNGAILLFDEADALFGKRSEVRDSHDRYANLEVSYLLQRIEAFRGLAILTTNLEDAVDTAFLRRLRFVVPFPFPGAAERQRIWRRVFPDATPTDGLDFERLGQLSVAGGNIRNIAMGAAFRAADVERPVTMTDLLEAARAELRKHGRPLVDAQVKGWVP